MSQKLLSITIRDYDYEALRSMLARYGYEYFGSQFTDRLLGELADAKKEAREVEAK